MSPVDNRQIRVSDEMMNQMEGILADHGAASVTKVEYRAEFEGEPATMTVVIEMKEKQS